MELAWPTRELSEQTEVLCEAVQKTKPHWAQTYVFKGPFEAFIAFKIFGYKSDARAWILRKGPQEAYLVMTLPKGENTDSFARRSAEKLKEYPGGGLLEYIRPLTMRLASLFGWARRVALPAGGTKLEMVPVPDTQYQRTFLHPYSPLPLFVLQPAKPSDGEKLSWIL